MSASGAQVKAVLEVPNGCLLPRLIDATLPEQRLQAIQGKGEFRLVRLEGTKSLVRIFVMHPNPDFSVT